MDFPGKFVLLGVLDALSRVVEIIVPLDFDSELAHCYVIPYAMSLRKSCSKAITSGLGIRYSGDSDYKITWQGA